MFLLPGIFIPSGYPFSYVKVLPVNQWFLNIPGSQEGQEKQDFTLDGSDLNKDAPER